MDQEQEEYNFNYKLASLCLGVFMLLYTALMAMGIIWTQQSVSGVASDIKKLESEISDVGRKNNYLQTQFAREHTPENLMSYVDTSFIVPDKDQIVWLNTEDQHRSVANSDYAPIAMNFNFSFLKD